MKRLTFWRDAGKAWISYFPPHLSIQSSFLAAVQFWNFARKMACETTVSYPILSRICSKRALIMTKVRMKILTVQMLGFLQRVMRRDRLQAPCSGKLEDPQSYPSKVQNSRFPLRKAVREWNFEKSRNPRFTMCTGSAVPGSSCANTIDRIALEPWKIVNLWRAARDHSSV